MRLSDETLWTVEIDPVAGSEGETCAKAFILAVSQEAAVFKSLERREDGTTY
jgi:hypothetical protein